MTNSDPRRRLTLLSLAASSLHPRVPAGIGSLAMSGHVCSLNYRDNVAVQEAVRPQRRTGQHARKPQFGRSIRVEPRPETTESGHAVLNRSPSFSSLLLGTSASVGLPGYAHLP